METVNIGGLQTAEEAAGGSRPRGKCELKCVKILNYNEIIVFHRVMSLYGCVKLLSEQRENVDTLMSWIRRVRGIQYYYTIQVD